MNIINKVYVINLKKRPDKWHNIQKDFSHTNLKLTRWNAIYGKDISENEFANKTTALCNEFCSPSMVGIWLSHYNIWQNIVKNKEDNVLILEDDALPLENFNYRLQEYWKEVPKDWDFVFFGCIGSCTKSTTNALLYKVLTGKYNEPVYKNGVKQHHIFRPCFPICMHAYMVSYKGAKKLINHPALKKIKYHIDMILCKDVFSDDDFKVYAFDPQLITQNHSSEYSDNQNQNHPIINYIGSKLSNKNEINVFSNLNTIIFHIRRLNISITHYTFYLLIISFIIGLLCNNIIKYYIMGILFLYSLETIYNKKLNNTKIKGLIVELCLAGIFLYFGYRVRNK